MLVPNVSLDYLFCSKIEIDTSIIQLCLSYCSQLAELAWGGKEHHPYGCDMNDQNDVYTR